MDSIPARIVSQLMSAHVPEPNETEFIRNVISNYPPSATIKNDKRR